MPLPTAFTPFDRRVLRQTKDWKSPIEVATAIHKRQPTMPQTREVMASLARLHQSKRVSYNELSNTYRQVTR